jgi:hypothetical protein
VKSKCYAFVRIRWCLYSAFEEKIIFFQIRLISLHQFGPLCEICNTISLAEVLEFCRLWRVFIIAKILEALTCSFFGWRELCAFDWRGVF